MQTHSQTTNPAPSQRLRYVLRLATMRDYPLITSSWTIGVRRSVSPNFDPHWVCSAQRGLIDTLLSRSTISVIIACDHRDDSEIFGYAVGERPDRVLHWVYVKPSYRSRKVRLADVLLTELFGDVGPKSNPLIISFETPAMRARAQRYNTRLDTSKLGGPPR